MGRRIDAHKEPSCTSDLSRPVHPITPSAPTVCLWCGRTLLVLLAVLSAALLSGGNARAQSTAATDRAALVALYDATDGANWTNNTNWLSSEPLSSWSQVLTDTNGRVTLLSLASNGLSGAIPSSLGNLTRLRILNLAENALSGEIPSSLGNLASLERLALNKNGLSGAIPSSLGDLTRLEILWLDSNGLSGAIPEELGDLTRLEQLNLNRSMG